MHQAPRGEYAKQDHLRLTDSKTARWSPVSVRYTIMIQRLFMDWYQICIQLTHRFQNVLQNQDQEHHVITKSLFQYYKRQWGLDIRYHDKTLQQEQHHYDTTKTIKSNRGMELEHVLHNILTQVTQNANDGLLSIS